MKNPRQSLGNAGDFWNMMRREMGYSHSIVEGGFEEMS